MATISQSLTTRYETKSWRQAGDRYGFTDVDKYYAYTGRDNIVGKSENDRDSALVLLAPFAFTGASVKLELSMTIYNRADSATNTYHWSLCTSRDNENAYKNAGHQTGTGQIADGTFTCPGTSGKYITETITITTPLIPANTALYLYLHRETDVVANFHFKGNITATLTYGAGGRTTPEVSVLGTPQLGNTIQLSLSGAESTWVTNVSYSIPGSSIANVLIGAVVGNGVLSWNTNESWAQYIAASGSTLNVVLTLVSTYLGASYTASMGVVFAPPDNLSASAVMTAVNTGSGLPASLSFIRGISLMHIAVSTENLYTASVASVECRGSGGNFLLYAASGNSSQPVAVSGSLDYTVIVTDSWGRATETAVSFTVLEYSPPSLGDTIARKYSTDPGTFDPEGTNARLICRITCTSLNAENSALLRFRYKAVTAADWGEWFTLASAVTSQTATYDLTGLTPNTGYQVQYSAVDTIGSETQTTLYIPPGLVYGAQVKSDRVGLGQKATHTNAVEINPAWDIWFKGSPILQVIYPVGSIYISVGSTSPALLFGGTWERIQNAFLFGASSTHSAGETGGTESVTLSTAQLPAHSHGLSAVSYPSAGEGTGYTGWGAQTDYGVEEVTATESAGSGESHNNMPPYLAVYIWKRTA